MAKAAEQFRAADVTVWGIIALGVWAVAILSANLSGIIPAGVYGALHASRLEGSTLNQLRTQVSALEEEAARAKREAAQLLQRFSLSEEATGSVTQRVGALEVSLPRLLEQGQTTKAIDSMSTGSIDGGKRLTFEADGGTVAVQQRPLVPGSGEVKLKVVPLSKSMPASISTSGATQGIAIGFPVVPESAEAQWQEMLAQFGSMLIGMSPVLADQGGSTVLVAGPVIDKASAIDLCAQLDKMGVPCQPAPFAGEPVPLLN